MQWLQIPNHSFKIIIVGCSESVKANSLLTLIKHQPEVDKIFFYVRDLYEPKYQYLIGKHKEIGLNISKSIRFSVNTQMICKMSAKVVRLLSRNEKKSFDSNW